MYNLIHSILNTIILLGVIQGFITSISLFSFKSNKKANQILAWLILLASLACLNIYFLETIKTTSIFWLVFEAIFPLVIIMPVGPLAYFYVKALLYPGFGLNKTHRIHFYTAFIDFIPYLTAVIYIIGGFLGLINSENNELWGSFIDTYNIYADIPRWLSLLVYIGLAYKMINNYPKNLKNKTLIAWGKRFVIGFLIFAVIWGIHLIFYLIPELSNKLLTLVGWYPIYIPLIILIYWLGVNGLIISLKAYNTKTLNLSETHIEETKKALKIAMEEEQLFLNPSLKLNDVVNHIDIPQKTISAVLNQHLGKTFNEYINEYRIETFKSRLLSNDSENLTITGIAFECGFNSQATFQRTFKAITQLSPKEFQQKHSKKE